MVVYRIETAYIQHGPVFKSLQDVREKSDHHFFSSYEVIYEKGKHIAVYTCDRVNVGLLDGLTMVNPRAIGQIPWNEFLLFN